MWWGVAFCAIGLICIGCCAYTLRRKRLIDDIPTSKTTGVFIGLVELKGIIESPAPFAAKLTKKPCVYCQWSVMEQWERWETETYYDSQDKTWKTRQVLKSGWTTLGSDTTQQSFFLRDDEGRILVDPQGATLETKNVLSETVDEGNSLYDVIYFSSIPDSTGKRQFNEEILEVGDKIYLMGYSHLSENAVEPEIGEDPESPVFLISVKDEKTISDDMWWSKVLLNILSAFFLGLSGYVFLAKEANAEIIGPAVGLAVFFLLWILMSIYMIHVSLVHLKNLVIQGLSNLDVQLKRRNDLIPRLVQVVEGIRNYERDVLQMTANLRSQRIKDNLIKNKGKLSTEVQYCSPQITILAERYPELKSNVHFLALQRELTNTENRIALARGYYNDLATAYNTHLEQIPDCFVAWLSFLRSYSLIYAQEFERTAPSADCSR